MDLFFVKDGYSLVQRPLTASTARRGGQHDLTMKQRSDTRPMPIKSHK
jgi:hypothetical protein